MPSGNLRIVVIGGGTGLACILRGLKTHPCDLSAVVTVADDGGSSGRLRKGMGILPPGDIRNCLLALAQDESEMASLLNHRFEKGDLKGHNFGNLFLAAMTEMTGDFQVAVRTMSRVLAVKGKVLPATLWDVTLSAEMSDGSVVLGEYAIPEAKKRVSRLRLVPDNPVALDEAVREIEAAHGVIIGPGSLYTSIIPNLLVPGIRNAVKTSRALKLYVCNIMTQPGETDGLSASDHVRAIEEHAGRVFTDVLINTAKAPDEIGQRYAQEGRFQVKADIDTLVARGYSVIAGDYLTAGDLARHDPLHLARSVFDFVSRGNTAGERKAAVTN